MTTQATPREERAPPDALTRIAYEWALRCFGHDHVNSLPVRALRTCEEAIELCQSLDVPEETVHALARSVYGRPKGSPLCEMGGTLLTARVMCAAMNRSPEEVFLTELQRVLSYPPELFRQRNESKNKMGFGAHNYMRG